MRVYTADRGWLGVMTGISAALTGGVLVIITTIVVIICAFKSRRKVVISEMTVRRQHAQICKANNTICRTFSFFLSLVTLTCDF